MSSKNNCLAGMVCLGNYPGEKYEATGALMGGISGYISANRAGANPWTGKASTTTQPNSSEDMLATMLREEAAHSTPGLSFGGEGDYIFNGGMLPEVTVTASKKVIINSTKQAWSHYMSGAGTAVIIGTGSINKLLCSKDFLFRHNRIINGQTRSLSGNFSVDMTDNVFHIGKTNVNYSINCASKSCEVNYELFVDDGFWDIDFIDEKVLGDWLGIDSFQPDGLGPNLERFGGTPYPYTPAKRTFSFPNPGY